jgi:hypothetical protein
VFTGTFHWSSSWARLNQIIPPHSNSPTTILEFPSHRCVGLPSGLFTSRSSPKPCPYLYSLSCVLHVLPISFSLTIYLWLNGPFAPWPLFLFPNLSTVGRTPWTGDQPVASPLPTHRKHKRNKRTHWCLEWIRTHYLSVHVSGGAAAVTGSLWLHF